MVSSSSTTTTTTDSDSTTNHKEEEEDGLKVLEELTRNASQIQDQLLLNILSQNANTEYLLRFHLMNHHHHLDPINNIKQVFKERVPVVVYEDIKPYIQRIASGQPNSHIISAQPITELLTSSGTSGGQPKMMPSTADDLERKTFFNNLVVPLLNKYIDGLDQGKRMYLLIMKPEIITPSGLLARSVVTSFFKNNRFENRPLNPFTSPKDTILCTDSKQSMYCQLLCGLVQRQEVLRVGAIFSSALLRAIKFLETYWAEMCSNIRTGQVSDWITDISCRNAVSVVLGNPSPELADLIELQCGGSSWEGIVKKIWPRTKCIDVVVTGSMAQYVPILEFYSGGIPLVSAMYTSSECFMGINLNPLSKPSDVSYTLIPNMAYFEFLPVNKIHDQDVVQCEGHVPSLGDESIRSKLVDLVDVQVGRCYELVVTTFTGLYRYRVGDILMATGFHNNAPQFQFVGRSNVVLSIDMDKTNEDDLLKAVMQAKLHLEPLGFILTEYTSYADTSSFPGHYVLFWELIKKKKGDDFCVGSGDNQYHNELGNVQLDPVVMESCCSTVEQLLDSVYRRCRKKDKSIGALEIRVVKEGTFDALMDFAVSKGSSDNQYKTPRCIKSAEALGILESRVVGRYLSKNVPSWEPFQITGQEGHHH